MAPVAIALGLLIAICVFLDSPGPIFYRSLRVGYGGEPFGMLKFRKMRNEARGPMVTAFNDVRLTPIGRFLQATRLDELPQFWHVLRGQMSIVGPRPERPEFLDLLRETVPFWTQRHLVKPGLTGWAQLRHGYTADADGTAEKLSYDLWYLRHRSLLVDVAVCAETFVAMATGQGAR